MTQLSCTPNTYNVGSENWFNCITEPCLKLIESEQLKCKIDTLNAFTKENIFGTDASESLEKVKNILKKLNEKFKEQEKINNFQKKEINRIKKDIKCSNALNFAKQVMIFNILKRPIQCALLKESLKAEGDPTNCDWFKNYPECNFKA